MAVFRTTTEVIDNLGGTEHVARLTGRKYNAAFNWRSFETFPPDTFLVMQRALEQAGHEAPPSLWRMVEAANAP